MLGVVKCTELLSLDKIEICVSETIIFVFKGLWSWTVEFSSVLPLTWLETYRHLPCLLYLTWVSCKRRCGSYMWYRNSDTNFIRENRYVLWSITHMMSSITYGWHQTKTSIYYLFNFMFILSYFISKVYTPVTLHIFSLVFMLFIFLLFFLIFRFIFIIFFFVLFFLYFGLDPSSSTPPNQYHLTSTTSMTASPLDTSTGRFLWRRVKLGKRFKYSKWNFKRRSWSILKRITLTNTE